MSSTISRMRQLSPASAAVNAQCRSKAVPSRPRNDAQRLHRFALRWPRYRPTCPQRNRHGDAFPRRAAAARGSHRASPPSCPAAPARAARWMSAGALTTTVTSTLASPPGLEQQRNFEHRDLCAGHMRRRQRPRSAACTSGCTICLQPLEILRIAPADARPAVAGRSARPPLRPETRPRSAPPPRRHKGRAPAHRHRRPARRWRGTSPQRSTCPFRSSRSNRRAAFLKSPVGSCLDGTERAQLGQQRQ